MSDPKPAGCPTHTGPATQTGRLVVPTVDGWVVEAGGGMRASSLHGTRVEAIDAAREAVARDGGTLAIRSHGGRTRTIYTIGRDPFRKISAVEGIVPTAAAEARAALFARTKLSSEERIRAIVEAHRPAED